MLFTQRFLEGIRVGRITLAFRRWRRPTVRTGGTLLTAVGQLEIAAVAVVPLDDISESDAARAGYDSRDALLAELARRTEGSVYRVELGALRTDPRIALRESPATSAEDSRTLVERLQRLDTAATGAWTRQVLEIVSAHPGIRAGDLCQLAGQEKDAFKINVRKLKNLGLTESLDVGYRLSPRGVALLGILRGQGSDSPGAAR